MQLIKFILLLRLLLVAEIGGAGVPVPGGRADVGREGRREEVVLQVQHVEVVEDLGPVLALAVLGGDASEYDEVLGLEELQDVQRPGFGVLAHEAKHCPGICLEVQDVKGVVLDLVRGVAQVGEAAVQEGLALARELGQSVAAAGRG